MNNNTMNKSMIEYITIDNKGKVGTTNNKDCDAAIVLTKHDAIMLAKELTSIATIKTYKWEPPEVEKVIHGLLVWNKIKSANYLDITTDKLTELVKDKRIIPDRITPYKSYMKVLWFAQNTLDLYLAEKTMDDEEEKDADSDKE